MVNFRGQFRTLRRADIGFVVTADFIFWAKSSRFQSNGVLSASVRRASITAKMMMTIIVLLALSNFVRNP